MTDNFNTKLNNLRNDLVNTINQSGMPVGTIFYLLKDLLTEISNSYKQSLIMEKQISQLIKEDENNNENDDADDGHQE